MYDTKGGLFRDSDFLSDAFDTFDSVFDIVSFVIEKGKKRSGKCAAKRPEKITTATTPTLLPSSPLSQPNGVNLLNGSSENSEEECTLNEELDAIEPIEFFAKIFSMGIFPDISPVRTATFEPKVHPFSFKHRTAHSSATSADACTFTEEFFTSALPENLVFLPISYRKLCESAMKCSAKSVEDRFLAAVGEWIATRSPLLSRTDKMTDEGKCPESSDPDETSKPAFYNYVGRVSFVPEQKEKEVFECLAGLFLEMMRKLIDERRYSAAELKVVKQQPQQGEFDEKERKERKGKKTILITKYFQKTPATAISPELMKLYYCFQYFNDRIDQKVAVWNFVSANLLLLKVEHSHRRARELINLIIASKNSIPQRDSWVISVVLAKLFSKVDDLENAQKYALEGLLAPGPFRTDVQRCLAKIRIKAALHSSATSVDVLSHYWFAHNAAVQASPEQLRMAVLDDCQQVLATIIAKERWNTQIKLMQVAVAKLLGEKSLDSIRTELSSYIEYTKKCYNPKTYPALFGFEWLFVKSHNQLVCMFNKLIMTFISLYIDTNEVFYYKKMKQEDGTDSQPELPVIQNILFGLNEEADSAEFFTPLIRAAHYVVVFGGLYGNMLFLRILEAIDGELSHMGTSSGAEPFVENFLQLLYVAQKAILCELPEYRCKEREESEEPGKVVAKQAEEDAESNYSSTPYAKRLRRAWQRIVKEIDVFIEKYAKYAFCFIIYD